MAVLQVPHMVHTFPVQNNPYRKGGKGNTILLSKAGKGNIGREVTFHDAKPSTNAHMKIDTTFQ